MSDYDIIYIVRWVFVRTIIIFKGFLLFQTRASTSKYFTSRYQDDKNEIQSVDTKDFATCEEAAEGAQREKNTNFDI
jgi:hypothetical protein